MCRFRVIHFTPHDVRVPLATNPFSIPGGPDEFMSTRSEWCHNCTDPFRSILDANVGSRGLFQQCDRHGCCVQWSTLESSCQWNVGQGHHLPAASCLNRLDVNEFRHIRMVIDTTGAHDHDASVRVCGSENWEWAGEMRPFPAEDMLYSNEIVVNEDEIPGSLSMVEERTRVEGYAEELWRVKGELQQGIVATEECLQGLELSLGGDVEFGLEHGLVDLTHLTDCVLLARELIRGVSESEVEAVRCFANSMEAMGILLTALEKMPAEGESITSTDGSFTVSQDQLNIGTLVEDADLLSACEGPLKQAGNLWRRLQEIEKVLQDLKIKV